MHAEIHKISPFSFSNLRPGQGYFYYQTSRSIYCYSKYSAVSITAASLTARGQPLGLKNATTYPTPSGNGIVVHNRAVVISPFDWAVQVLGEALFHWLKLRTIVDEDVAAGGGGGGGVAEVDSGVTGFKVGDRVEGHALAASQTHPVIHTHMTSSIPESVSHGQAAVIPLCVFTAVLGLFRKDYLGLRYPFVDPKPTGKMLLIWGGSTSVGSNAFQCAVAAGCEVVTTALPKNFIIIA